MHSAANGDHMLTLNILGLKYDFIVFMAPCCAAGKIAEQAIEAQRLPQSRDLSPKRVSAYAAYNKAVLHTALPQFAARNLGWVPTSLRLISVFH